MKNGIYLASEPKSLFNADTANRVSAALNADSDDWAYKVHHCPDGLGQSYIEIIDENGEHIAFW